MGKDPAFLFYPGDWLGGTMGMTFEEKGAYMELLMLQFNRGHMTSHMIGQTVGQLWENLESKFKKDKDGLYYSERLDFEKQKRQSFTKSRRNNVKGNNQHTKKEGHMTLHMENKNEIVNLDEDNNKGKVPEISEFLNYGQGLCQEVGKKYESMEFSLKAKYDTWVEDGWKDGHGKEIKNWKTKLRNTLPHLKEIQGTRDGQHSERKTDFASVSKQL